MALPLLYCFLDCHASQAWLAMTGVGLEKARVGPKKWGVGLEKWGLGLEKWGLGLKKRMVRLAKTTTGLPRFARKDGIPLTP